MSTDCDGNGAAVKLPKESDAGDLGKLECSICFDDISRCTMYAAVLPRLSQKLRAESPQGKRRSIMSAMPCRAATRCGEDVCRLC